MNVGIQEKPKKKHAVSTTWKKSLPGQTGRGYSPCYNTGQKQEVTRVPSQVPNDGDDDNNLVPENIKKEFVKANRVYYIVLDKRYKTSEKQITKCRGCDGAITLADKHFPNNMVFRYKYYRMAPQGGGKWGMSTDKCNCYFHACDMGCLYQITDLLNTEILDVYMDNKNFKDLKPENRRVLERKHYWDAIVEIRAKLAQDGHI